ncbi:MAG: valine--tRNA ligase [Patescibacteria group bacterium]|nr:valine--tRNA ligase [Patescibacteria group bacterium]
MEPTYKAKKYENRVYQLWQKSGFFNPDKLPGIRKRTYTIVIPPPNVTGSLHLGHALNNTIQDILIRFYRMNGYRTLWLPGTDHAGIATQNVVEKELKKEGLTRHQLGRTKFVARVWQWVRKYGNLIINQLKKLGCSCDWSRKRFTLDRAYTKAVREAFVHYYKKGLIYRGPRIVNWCPRCTTAISDIEVKYQEVKGKLWYIKYPLKNSKFETSNTDPIQNSQFNTQNYITVATTRPETMLGDTAVAVNPNDERYQKLIGKTVILPLINREIPIITHRLVDSQFGTGAVKITPAHDATDWQIGREKKLAIINVIGPEGKMTEEAGKYAGLTILEARERILDELRRLDLIEKEEEYWHNLALCDRCGTPIEPQISIQWFLKMKKISQPAIKAVERKKIKIIPERYKKIYLDWLGRVEDWCLSRQLWWGHQLPVWYCQTGRISNFQPPISKQMLNSKFKMSDSFIVANKKPKRCPICRKCEMKPSEDVLDTWFSSALWPFATLGWPKKTKDLKNYYPTNFLSTAQEILYLWVARMIFSSLEFTKKIPFKDVYIHPTVLAITGKRMSKSLGTGIDPLEIGEKYGFDSVRFGLIYQINRDQQAFKFDERAILAARNFINKLWNISRFTQIQISKLKFQNYNLKLNLKLITLADKWILSRLNSIIDSVTKKIKNYELGEAERELYDFIWHELADWYLEIAKIQNTNERLQRNTVFILHHSLIIILKLLHPFIPFVTEVVYQRIKIQNSKFKIQNLLIVEDWPKVDKKLINQGAEKDFEKIKNLVIEIRNWRAKEKTPPQEIREYKIKKPEKILTENRAVVEALTKVKLI